MITEIHGDTNTFRALAYGRPDALTIDWCRQLEQQHIANLDPAAAQQYHALAGTVYGGIDFDQIAAMSRALHNQSDSMWLVNAIIPLRTIDQLQIAPPVMIPWLMACPEVRQAYHSQIIAGYDDYYIDPEPNKVGEDHYHYRRVMNGIFVEDADGLTATEWFEDLATPTDELGMADQLIIMNAWSVMVDALAANDRDPTSRFNAQL